MSERDELTDLIAFETVDAASGDLIRCSADGETPVFKVDERLADAILAAGYRKPRTVGTVADLDALPDTSAILDEIDGVLVRVNGWWRASDGAKFDSMDIILPATILWEPR